MKTESFSWRPQGRDLWLLGAALLCFFLLAATLELPAEEDAFIYYRYAWNWAHGNGLVFNTGEPVEGFSGPAWMGVLAVVARLGLDLPMTAPALGLLCGAATLVATWFLARTVGLSRFGQGASVAGLALSYPFVVWSRSGLETPFYSLAIVVAVGAYLAAEYPLRAELRRRRWIGSLALVLVCLGRPEGLLLVAVVLIDRLTDGWDWPGALRYVLPPAAAYGGYLLYRALTFHSLVPNTSVKLYPLLFERASSQFLGYLLYLGLLPLALPVLALLGGRRRARPERRRLGVLLSAVFLLSFFFNFVAGGDYRPAFRYLIPTLPLLLVAVWYGCELLGRERDGRFGVLSSPWARASLLLLLLAGPLFLLHQNPPRIRDWRQKVFQSWRDPFSQTWHWGVQIAHWVDRNVPQNGVVAFGQMGRVPYFVARRGHEVEFIDTLGLVDGPISRIYRFDSKLADLWRDLRAGRSLAQALEKGRRERANRVAASILVRRPDFILIETALADYRMMRALVESPDFKAAYREIGGLPPEGPPDVRIYVRDAVPPAVRGQGA
jgi:hypothetical protein